MEAREALEYIFFIIDVQNYALEGSLCRFSDEEKSKSELIRDEGVVICQYSHPKPFWNGPK